LAVSGSLTKIQPEVASQAAKESDLEMFYFSSEMPNNKTLMKTRKIFRGICKHLHLESNNQNEANENPPKTFSQTLSSSKLNVSASKINTSSSKINSSSSKINSETNSAASHQYQHQNIFKTLLKSKSNHRQRKASESSEQNNEPTIQAYRALEEKVHSSDKRQQIPDRPPMPPPIPPPPERPNQTSKNKRTESSTQKKKSMAETNKKDKANKTRIEKLINELSTPEAIQALRNRYDTNENANKKYKNGLKLQPNLKSKDNFNGHMKELVHVLNEKFGGIDTTGSSTRNNTQRKKKQQRTISSKNKSIYNTASRYNTKRKNGNGTIIGKKKSSALKKRRSTRIGWR
jgi:hypothetical protein